MTQMVYKIDLKMFAEKNNGNLIIRSEIDDSALLFLGEDNKRFNAVYTYVWDELFLGMKSTSGSDKITSIYPNHWTQYLT